MHNLWPSDTMSFVWSPLLWILRCIVGIVFLFLSSYATSFCSLFFFLQLLIVVFSSFATFSPLLATSVDFSSLLLPGDPYRHSLFFFFASILLFKGWSLLPVNIHPLSVDGSVKKSWSSIGLRLSRFSSLLPYLQYQVIFSQDAGPGALVSFSTLACGLSSECCLTVSA